VSMDPPPLFDDHGINLADPNDRRGIKSAYITCLQVLALRELVGASPGRVLDLGCGFGRMTGALADLGWEVVGAEPSVRVLRHGRIHRPAVPFVAAALPRLPFLKGAFDTILLINVIRTLHLLGIKDVIGGAADLIDSGGRLVVLDNIRPGHPDYIDESWLIEYMQKRGLSLEKKRAIRASRWPPIYAIRYGLVPRALLPWMARWEISRMARASRPRFGYHNTIFVFRRPR